VPFSDPIIGGQGALIRSAIHSPNYVPGVSGWSINKDGTAEFASATLHGTLPVDDLTSGTLDADAVLGAGAVRTPGAGARVVLDAAGLRGYNSTGDETINIDATTGDGTFTGNISVVDLGTGDTLGALTNEGNFSGPNAFLSDDVFVAGLGIVGQADVSPNIPKVPGSTDAGGGIIDSLPFGLVSYGPFLVNGSRTVASGVTWGVCSQSFQAEIGRSYVVELQRLRLSAAASSGYHTISLRLNTPAFNGDQTTATPTVGGGSFTGYLRFPTLNTQMTASGRFGVLRCGPGLEIPFSGLVQIVLDLQATTTTISYQQPASSFPYVAECNVYDVGPTIGATTGYLDQGAGGSTNPTKTYKKTYTCNDSGSYDSGGSYIGYYATEMVVGNYSGSGIRKAMAIFPSMTSDLSGATITGMSITFHNHHTYYNSGATFNIGLHGNTSLPGTYNSGTGSIIAGDIAKGATKTVAIPSAYWSGFISGSYRGFNMSAPSSSLDYYSKYDGSAYTYKPSITVTYVK